MRTLFRMGRGVSVVVAIGLLSAAILTLTPAGKYAGAAIRHWTRDVEVSPWIEVGVIGSEVESLDTEERGQMKVVAAERAAVQAAQADLDRHAASVAGARAELRELNARLETAACRSSKEAAEARGKFADKWATFKSLERETSGKELALK